MEIANQTQQAKETETPQVVNPLWDFFLNRSDLIVHKWIHYFDIYHRYFGPYRKKATPDKKIIMLEIGVFHGGSLQMWNDYFGKDQCELYAIDVDPSCKRVEKEGTNIKVFLGDQGDANFLASVVAQIPPPDIILDDGGHTMIQQNTSFDVLFPHLKPGGVYMCEDLHTSYWPAYGGALLKPDTFIEKSKAAVDKLNAHHWGSPVPGGDYVIENCSGVHFHDSIAVFDKSEGKLPNPSDRVMGARRLW